MEDAVPLHTCVAGVAGALLSSGLGVMAGCGPAAFLLLLVLGGALPMWWLEWRRHGRLAGASPSVPAGLLRQHALLGVVALTLLFATVITLQLRLGGEKGVAVAVLEVPLLGLALLLLMTALLWPAAIGPTVLRLGEALRCLLRRQPLDAAQSVLMRSWLVRAFFLPLMLGWAYVWVAGAQAGLLAGSLGWVATLVALLYAVDTAFAVIGYLVAGPSTGAQVRSVDATWLGWLAALACYPPLSVVVLEQWLHYKDGLQWDAWLGAGHWLYLPWAGAIVLLTAIYVWATVVFGPRFSNLTWRGLVSAGPYRWCRHPAYVSKNLSWWLISVPFVSAVSTTQAVLHCLALLGVNGIYAMRAWTEERHLRQFPEYVAYAQWVDTHGVWARLCRMWQ